MSKKQILGAIIGIMACALGIYWFSWKLSLIMFLALWGNNLERK